MVNSPIHPGHSIAPPMGSCRNRAFASFVDRRRPSSVARARSSAQGRASRTATLRLDRRRLRLWPRRHSRHLHHPLPRQSLPPRRRMRACSRLWCSSCRRSRSWPAGWVRSRSIPVVPMRLLERRSSTSRREYFTRPAPLSLPLFLSSLPLSSLNLVPTPLLTKIPPPPKKTFFPALLNIFLFLVDSSLPPLSQSHIHSPCSSSRAVLVA